MRILQRIAAYIFAAIIFLALAGSGLLVHERIASNALAIQGFSDIQITNRAWFLVGLRGCDEKDSVRFDATATNPLGKRVSLYVCSGWIFKGATIRSR